MLTTTSRTAHGFGAKGDGRADDTAALQKALDASSEEHQTVFVPPGTYRCSTLVLHEHASLAAHPVWACYRAQGAIIQLADPAASCLFDITQGMGISLYGLCLHGDNLDTGIILRDLDDCVIAGNTLWKGALKQFIADRGEHGPNLILRDNPGSLGYLA